MNALASRYIKVDELPWKPSGYPGVERLKRERLALLLIDKDVRALTRIAEIQHRYLGV